MGDGKKMTCRTMLAGFAFWTCIATGAHAAPNPVEIRKEVPAHGSVKRGDVVYVDDGKCPAGEVKKITGGSQSTGVARQVECVKRPESR